MADLIAAATAHDRAVMGATHEDQAWSHRQWIEYLKSIGLSHDPFLNRFNRCQQNLLICAFATAVREGRFSRDAFKTLAAGTVRNTISSMCVNLSSGLVRPFPILKVTKPCWTCLPPLGA
jgi:hypothetical protein